VTRAIFGGTFDPVHFGHLILAEQVAGWAGLAEVIFIPAGRPPHKEGRTAAAASDRLAMVEEAVAGNRRFTVSRIELEGEGGRLSFTIDTVRRLKAEGAGEVALILGADSLVELATWREPEALVVECRVLVVPRPGWDLSEAPDELRRHATPVPVPLIDISSRMIRQRVAAGLSIRYLVPEAVRRYILDRGLYREAEKGPGAS
jgi:nicotinate-nucleotide adenylyltransferase